MKGQISETLAPGAEPPHAAEDRALIAAAAQGSEAAFGRLYDRLAGPLYSLCVRMLGDRGDAEEVLQEACVQLWRRAAAYDPGQSTVFGWAMHITRCKVIDRLRLRSRRLRVLVPEETQLPGELSVIERVASADAEPADTLDRSDRAVRVRGILNELPAEQRQAIEMAFFSDLSHHEIADRLSEPLGTIKARIRRGLLRMRDALGYSL